LRKEEYGTLAPYKFVTKPVSIREIGWEDKRKEYEVWGLRLGAKFT